jgi:hypothetical protein
MDTKQAIDQIRAALDGVSKSGVQSVQISALLTYLSELERNAPLATEAVKFQQESNLAFYKSQHETNLEMLRSVIGAGKTAVSTCILINGGAAVTLLAFIGNIYSKSPSAVSVPKGLSTALAAFSFAVLLAGTSAGIGYLAQRDFQRNPQKQENNFNVISILFVAVAYILFGVGIVAAHYTFAG